nr:alpha/beta hydrolase [Aneurinibacillus sp. XH2]
MKSKAFEEGQRHIWKYLMEEFDLPALGTQYQAPVFYIHGERDWQTPYSLAKQFFLHIEAPLKRFCSVPDAGHVTMLDQKEKFNDVILDILEQI